MTRTYDALRRTLAEATTEDRALIVWCAAGCPGDQALAVGFAAVNLPADEAAQLMRTNVAALDQAIEKFDTNVLAAVAAERQRRRAA